MSSSGNNPAPERPPSRRDSTNFTFECGTFTCVATVSFFTDGRVGEIFLGNGKAGSTADAIAKDSAVVASIALQYGAPLEVIRRALLRDSQRPRICAARRCFRPDRRGVASRHRFADARCSDDIDEAAE
jgi:hypothetical protein